MNTYMNYSTIVQEKKYVYFFLLFFCYYFSTIFDTFTYSVLVVNDEFLLSAALRRVSHVPLDLPRAYYEKPLVFSQRRTHDHTRHLHSTEGAPSDQQTIGAFPYNLETSAQGTLLDDVC